MKPRQVIEANRHVRISATSSRMFAMAVVLAMLAWTQKLPGAEGGNLWLPPVEVTNSGPYFHHISDGAGGTIVASVDGSSSGPVYVSRIGTSGSIVWGPVQLSTAGVSGTLPRLCSDGTGGVIVAWAQDVSGGQSIYVQRVNSSGIPQWASPICASSTNNSLNALEVAAGNQAMFLVYRASAAYSVSAAHISAAGVVASPGLGGLWLGNASFYHGVPRLVPDGSGGNGVIIAWADPDISHSTKAQRVVLSGGTLNQAWGSGSPITICSTASGDGYHPAVAQDGTGGALISWTELYPPPAMKGEVRVQKVNSSGIAQWTANGVVLVDSTVVGGTNWWYLGGSSAIAGDGNGGAYVAWDDWRNDFGTNNVDVYAQHVNASGVRQWISGDVNLGYFTPGSQSNPRMITDLQGGALVAFEDKGGWSVDISLVKLNSAGKQWFRWVFSDGTSPGNPGYDQHSPALIYDASGPTPKGCIVAWAEKNWAAYVQKVEMAEPEGVHTLLSCSGEPGGDLYTCGFYVVSYPGVSLNSARLELSAANAGSYVLALTVRSNTYDGPILGVSTNTVTLSSDVYDNQPVIFTFPSTPISKGSRVCFILSLVSGPGTQVYYSVPTSGGCTEVVETEGTTPPLDTFRRYGVNLVLTGSSIPQTLLSCSGTAGGDYYYHGFYVPQYPGVSLNSAQLKLSAAVAGSYALTLTVRSNTYDGPVLAASTTTVTLNGSTTENQPVTFTFPSTPIAKDSRVCFILSSAGPSTSVYYLVPEVTGGCTEVVQTEGTTPPLDTFRRYGVNLVLSGVNDPGSGPRLLIAHQPAGVYLHWNCIAGRTYTVQTNGNLQLGFNALQTGIYATPPMNTFGPIVPSPAARQFYRIFLDPLPVP